MEPDRINKINRIGRHLIFDRRNMSYMRNGRRKDDVVSHKSSPHVFHVSPV
jgi:hypothetical protein